MRLRYLLLMIIASTWRPLVAASFTPVWVSGTETQALIMVQGDIVPGDPARLMAAMNSVAHARPGAKTVAIDLNTPGGEIQAGSTLAAIITANNLNTVLYPGATCASACALMFFAGDLKILGAGARIGVHRASRASSGDETPGTLASSADMARVLTGMGASRRVTDKLIATPPGSIAWLTGTDLAGVRGLIYGPPPSAAPSDEFQRGWNDARSGQGVRCPADMSAYSDGCRAASGRSTRP